MISQRGKRTVVKIKTLPKHNLLNTNKADKAATKHSTGHCKKINKLSTRSPTIAVINHLQIGESNASEKIFHPQSYNEAPKLCLVLAVSAG